MKRLLQILIFTISILSCARQAIAKSMDDEHIIVKLATESQLIPLYLRNVASPDTSFDKNYLDKLSEILSFDLNYNGMTQVVGHSSDKDRLAANSQFEELDNLESWKKLNVFYVIKAQVQNRKLAVRMLAVNSTAIKKADDIPLTGDLSQDRRQIHRVADMIHKALFDTPGIATTHILYTVKRTEGSKPIAEVWEMDYDGGNARQITSENCLCVTPAYIPPKPGFTTNSFLYVCYRNGQPKIYIGNLKGGKGQRLTTLRGNQLMPGISRQRNNVAFICDVTGNPDLFVQPFSPEAGAMGKPQQVFSTFKATQGTPSFNPEGNKLAFVSNKDGSPRIYTLAIPAPGTKIEDVKATLITKHGKESTAPAWSPDGSKLAYSSMTNGVRQIWIYDFNTREERQLTQGAGHKENPVWGPDSLHLTFNSVSPQGSELYLVNLNQPEAVRITSGSGEKRFPSWEPKG